MLAAGLHLGLNLVLGLSGVLFALPAQAQTERSVPEPVILAPADRSVTAPVGRSMDFTPPPVGSYNLPAIGPAADAEVLQTDGSSIRLHQLYDDKIILLSFIFTRCQDACPLAQAVLYRLYRAIQADPQLASTVRLLSLSFDPRFDTPAVMRSYSKGLGEPQEWRFLTTVSEQKLAPLLAKYDQNRIAEYDQDGNFSGNYAHVMRVFLIDRDRNIRNVYSSSFLFYELLLNDIKTLLQEEKS